eukprot:TRINITY_DN6672_c0_g1_i13.p1 TRINITY_DN6672_c0_g1~~TRINITY_DN6672_c0_g1_i13.p1  ORF type:complete len:216 (-),score=54.73 TRINITY_DN6672_c0_g1_i13:98-745(-)
MCIRDRNRDAQELPPLRESTMTLKELLPSYKYEQYGQQWQQDVSKTPATKDDVENLEKELEKRLKQDGARETGICPVREKYYTQCFDELLRQIAIQCMERGFLLKDVRDTFFDIRDKYKELCESMLGYGIRRDIQGKIKQAKIEEEIRQLEQDCSTLEKTVCDLNEEAKRKLENAEVEEHLQEAEHKKIVEEKNEYIQKQKKNIKEKLQKTGLSG